MISFLLLSLKNFRLTMVKFRGSRRVSSFKNNDCVLIWACIHFSRLFFSGIWVQFHDLLGEFVFLFYGKCSLIILCPPTARSRADLLSYSVKVDEGAQ